MNTNTIFYTAITKHAAQDFVKWRNLGIPFIGRPVRSPEGDDKNTKPLRPITSLRLLRYIRSIDNFPNTLIRYKIILRESDLTLILTMAEPNRMFKVIR